jgi:hypothetical protein
LQREKGTIVGMRNNVKVCLLVNDKPEFSLKLNMKQTDKFNITQHKISNYRHMICMKTINVQKPFIMNYSQTSSINHPLQNNLVGEKKVTNLTHPTIKKDSLNQIDKRVPQKSTKNSIFERKKNELYINFGEISSS